LCESSGSNFAKAKVLYCYGEVVLQRALPGTEEKEEESLWFLDIDLLQILQLVVVVLFILAILIVLLTIRSGINMIEKQLKKVVVNLKRAPSWSSEDENLESGNLNRVFLKRDNTADCHNHKDSFDMDIAAVTTLQKK